MRAIRTGLNAAGIPVENSKGEASAGQEEINVRYAGALDIGRRPCRSPRTRCKEIAWAKGRAVTFMAKYDRRRRGLVEPPAPVAAARGRQARPSSTPASRTACRELMRRGWRGCSPTPAETTYFLAPYVNSYKRFVAGTFAPTKTVWSTDNRTAGFRLVGEGHASRSGSSAGSAGPTSTPISPSPRRSPPASTASSAELELGPEFRGDAYVTGALPRDPEDAARRDRGARRARRCCARPSATRSSSTTCMPPAGSSPSATAGSPTGSWRAASSAPEACSQE